MITDVSIIARLSKMANNIKYTIVDAKMTLKSSMEATDTDNTKVSMYLQRSKVSSQHCTNTEIIVVQQKLEDTWGTMVYTEK